MSGDQSHQVARSALSFLSGTLISRFTGMFRDVAMAFCFGAHPAIAAFMVAFRFSNLIRRLFGEGTLPSVFIPHFESVRSGDPKEGAKFFRDTFMSLTVFLIGIILVLEICLYGWLKWGGLSIDAQEILTLTMLMLPGILFICLFGISSALLQCEKSFFLPGVAPIAFNIVWIGAVFWLKDLPPIDAMKGLSLGIVLAFFMQWMMTIKGNIDFLKSFLTLKEFLSARLFSKEMNALLKPFLLGVIGIGAVQINSALDALFARFASLEGPAYLWYAIRLQQLPLALFGIALSSALLPSLSRTIKAGLTEEFKNLLHFSLKRSFSLIMPCTIGILVLGAASVNLIYNHGDFNKEATLQTVLCLWGYGIGLIPAVFVMLLAPAFYAQKNYRLPTISASLSVLLSVALNALMVFVLKWGAFSIAVTTSIAAYFNFQLLSYLLAPKIGPLFTSAVMKSFFKTTVCSLIAGATTLFLGHYLASDPTLKIMLSEEGIGFSREVPTQMLQFFVMAGSFFLILFSYAWMINAEDLLGLFNLRKKEGAVE